MSLASTSAVSANFSFPTTIVFGAGRVRELTTRAPALGANKPLIVTDAGLMATPAFRKVMDAAPAGVPVFSDTKSNPTADNVDAATNQFRQQACDSVIGLGGGSAIDVAKIVRLAVNLPQWNRAQPVPDDPLGALAPFIAIPPTAGTGSEVG